MERFLALVRRDLGAEDVRVLEADAEAPESELSLSCRMEDGRTVVVTFTASPSDREAKQRRLEILTGTLEAAVEEPAHGRRSRAPVTSTLHDELSALSVRAAALNVIVIDANSPVVWGAAHPE